MSVRKIAMVCNTLGGGGAEAVMSTLGKLFVEKGMSIDFIVTNAEGVYLEKVNQYAQLINLNTKTRYLAPKLYNYLKAHKPDIVFSTLSHINLATIVAAKFANRKSVVREATTPSIAFSTNNSKLKLPVKAIYPFASQIVSVSNGVKRDLIENFNINKHSIQTIYNPIISNEFFSKSEEKIDHPWFKLNIPVIVSMGRFAEAKDYPTLIRAFNLIRKDLPCKLIILGDTESKIAIKNKVLSLIKKFELSQDIDMVGFKKNPFPYLKNSALYILSSKFEGLPGALIQAVALGCNVISTDCESGPKEILDHGKYGRLVKIGDFKKMASEAKTILRSPHKNKSIVSDGFLKKYSEEGICKQYLNLFEEL